MLHSWTWCEDIIELAFQGVKSAHLSHKCSRTHIWITLNWGLSAGGGITVFQLVNLNQCQHLDLTRGASS